MDSKITVIVPVYNMDKYLKTCFDSILAQTYTNFELLIVNDGSTDNSAKICNEYMARDSRVRVIHTENQGQDMARNTALANVHTDLLAMVDADDCVNCHYLEILYQAMQQTDADMVSGLALNFESDEQINYLEETILKEEDVQVFTGKQRLEELCMYYDAGIPVPHKLYKRKVFEGVKYPPVRVNIDEWTIHHLLLNCEKVAVVPVRLYYYRYSPEGMTRNFSLKKISGVNAQLERIQTLSAHGMEYLIPHVYGKFYEKAEWFYLNCKKEKLKLPKQFYQLKSEIRKAYTANISKRTDLFSRREMLVKYVFGYSFWIYDSLKKLLRVE